MVFREDVVQSAAVGWGILCMSVRSWWFIVSISPLCPSIVELSVSPFSSVSVCLMYFQALMFGAHMFIIVTVLVN